MTVVDCQIRAQQIYRRLLGEGLEPDDVLLNIPQVRITRGCDSATRARVATHDVRLQLLRLVLVDLYGESDEMETFYREARPRVDAMPF